MPEPIEQTPEVELATLRKVNADLLKTKHEQKARITALEADVLAATEKADKATATMRATVIDLPLSRIVQELAPNVPSLVLKELHEDFTFDAADDGSIVIKSKAEGKPMHAKDGKPILWEKHSLHSFLVGQGYVDKSDRQRVYQHLLGIPAGSGGVGRVAGILARQGKPSEEKKDQSLSFGLR